MTEIETGIGTANSTVTRTEKETENGTETGTETVNATGIAIAGIVIGTVNGRETVTGGSRAAAVELIIGSPKSDEMESGVSARAVAVERGHLVDGLRRRETGDTFVAPSRDLALGVLRALVVVTVGPRIPLLVP